MAIKAFEVSFLISTEEMLAFVAHRNTAVKINALQDGKSHLPKALGHQAPKLLEGPKKTRPRGENGIAWHRMLEAFAIAPDHSKSTRELGKVLHNMGLSPKSVSPQVSMMQKKGWLRRTEPGIYQMTAKGGVEAQKLGYRIADTRVKAKPKTYPTGHRSRKPPKGKPAPEIEIETPATATPEEANG